MCRTEPPPAVPVGEGHFSLCYHTSRIGEIPAPPADVPSPHVSETAPTVLSLEGVSKTFTQSGHHVYALAGIDLELRGGETLGLVGESGSGKTTLAKAILGIHTPDEGSVMS